MKRKLTILATAMFVLVTLSPLITPLRAQVATHDIVQERSSSDIDSLGYQIDEILDSGKLVFLYFYKEGCYACRLQEPLIEELEREYSDEIVFIRVNGPEDRRAMAKFGVRGFPTMFLISGRNEEEYEYVDFMGYTEKSVLKNKIDNLTSPVVESVETLESADLSYEVTSETLVVETGLEDIVPTGTTYYCTNCADCNSKLAAASSGDTVKLTTDILNHVGSCIIIRNDGVTFDGDYHIIDGDGVGTDEYGVGVIGRAKNTIIHCRITDFYYGIYLLDRADATSVIKNEVGAEKTPNTYGIYIYGCYDVLVQSNLVRYNAVDGIVLRSGSSNTVLDNEVVGHARGSGIWLYYSTHNLIQRNTVSDNDDGIYAYWGAHNNSIRENDVYRNVDKGVQLWSANDNQVVDNSANYNSYGFYLRDSNRTLLTDNTANYNEHGIWLFYAYYNQVVGNTANYNKADGSGCGIHSEYSSNTIDANTVSYNFNGICLYRDYGWDIIKNNTVLHNDYIGLSIQECISDTIVGYNTISSNYFGIRVIDSQRIWIGFYFLPIPNTVENNEWIGISVGDSTPVIIAASYVNSNYHGIYLWGESDENIIQANQIVYNDYYGVWFASTANNNTLNMNVICHNLIDIKDFDANSGDDNTCNTPDGWNDDGTTGCTYSCPSGWCYDYDISAWINPPTTGDWNVNHRIECNDTEITLNGNLFINGELRFNHVKLMMNVTNMEYLGNIYRIEVNSGGAFYINSKDDFPSIITNGLNETAHYNFKVKSGSTFEMRDSELYNCGWAWNPPPTDDLDLAGLWIATDGVIIEDNLIDNNYAGMIFYNSGHHRIIHNMINHSDSFGVYGFNSPNNEIEGNVIRYNGWNWYALEGGGILLTGASNSFITGNVAHDNKQGSGIALYDAQNSTVTGNRVYASSWDGISLSGAQDSVVTENVANSNGWNGISLSGASKTIVTDNVAYSNGWSGISLSGADSLIARNVAEHNDWGIRVHGASSNKITITDNDANFNTGGWPIVESAGIFLDGCWPSSFADQNIIVNNRVLGNPNGILVEGSRYATVTENTATSSTRGFYLLDSRLIEVSYNNASYNTGGTGISLSGSHENGIFKNLAEWNFNGIHLHSSSGNEILNNIANFNNFGISLRRSSNNNAVIDNDARSCEEYGAYLYRADNNHLEGNDFFNSKGTGVYLERSHGNDLVDNIATHAKNYGINLLESNRTLIDLNDVRFSGDIGIELSSSHHNNLTRNTAEGSDIGISIRFSIDNRIEYNAVGGNDIGIYLIRSSYTTIFDNDASMNNNVGIDLSLSNYNKIIHNSVNVNPNYGIHLYSSQMNTIENNWAISNGIGIYLDWSSSNAIRNNTATHNEFAGIAAFWSSDHNEIVLNQAHSNMNISIRISSSSFNHVEGNNASLSGVGIFLDWSENNWIGGNTANFNAYHGIALEWFSDNNVVTNNSVIGSPERESMVGISLDMSSFNNVSYNDANFNDIGILLEWSSNNNTLYHNTMAYNDYHGLSFHWESNYNIIANNTIGHNYEYGVYIYQCANNTMYHNDIVYNIDQAFDLAPADNDWHHPALLEGNYWSDYPGADDGSGTGKHAIAGDGIGDTDIPWPDTDYDFYPLMSGMSVLTHDVAILDVTLSKNIVGEGYPVVINVTVQNQGEYTETFNVTIYYDATEIGRVEVTLTPGSFLWNAFTWDTTGVAKGNYTITAKATILPEEIDTADNTFPDGWVVVTIPGDVDGDYDVDFDDIVAIAMAYGSKPGDPNWNPIADLNGDNDVDFDDVVTAAMNYGKTDC